MLGTDELASKKNKVSLLVGCLKGVPVDNDTVPTKHRAFVSFYKMMVLPIQILRR